MLYENPGFLWENGKEKDHFSASTELNVNIILIMSLPEIYGIILSVHMKGALFNYKQIRTIIRSYMFMQSIHILCTLTSA
jgi:hypothetical protein